MHKLEQLLNLPESKEIIEETKRVTTKAAPAPSQPLFRDIEDMDKISAALPFVKGLGDISDNEFDALAQRATDAYDDLMDLGMNVEARYSGRVFEVASAMLKNAIDAKSAKIDKKLKMIELQLKKQKLDSDNQVEQSVSVSGDGYIVTDRNSLIEKLKNMK
jgi:hypothetical protein